MICGVRGPAVVTKPGLSGHPSFAKVFLLIP
jgi:hypothetical protein